MSSQAPPAEVQLESIGLPRQRSRGVPMPLAVLGDERLAQLVGAGNERAFSALFSRHHQQLYRYCHSMVRNEADAQDVLQSTFTAALVALRRGQRNAPLRPWLFRIAHNEAVSLLRRSRPELELSEDIVSSRASIEDAAQDRARLAELVADLQLLPARQRSALVMRELSGLSHEDLAQALGISVGAAKQAVFEARRALHEFATGRAMPCEQIQRTLSDRDGRALRSRRVRAHLRDCSACSAFAAAIPQRRADLMALSPALPAAAASGLLAKITGAETAHHAGGGGVLAAATGKSVGLAVSAKTLATGAALLATAVAGTVGAVEIATHSAPPSRLVRSGRPGASSATGGHASPAGRVTRAVHGRAPAPGARPPAAGRGRGGSASAHPRGGGGPSSSRGHSKHGGNAHARGGSPNAHGGNPNARGGNPNAHGGNPKARGGKANPSLGNPNAHGGNPNARGGNLSPSLGNPDAHGGNPNAHGGSANAHGGNPNAAGWGAHPGATNS